MDATTQAPIPGATVVVGGVEVLSEADGGFRFSDLPTGPLDVLVLADGYEAYLDRRRAPCAPAQVSIPIIAEVEVEGTVLVVRKDLVVRFGAQTRANPGLTEMLFNGMPARDYVLGSEYALSARLDLSVADRVCIADDPSVTRVEPVTVYAYASAGDLADPSFEIAAPPEDSAAMISGAVSWTAPRAGELGSSGSVELWLVATDQDGGIAVVHRSLTAR